LPPPERKSLTPSVSERIFSAYDRTLEGDMKKSTWLAYAIAIIWAIALIATAVALKGTPQSNLVIEILSACAVLTSVLLILSCKQESNQLKS
jgi:predicted neutral ceramidase superfamily lipid hydrolase